MNELYDYLQQKIGQEDCPILSIHPVFGIRENYFELVMKDESVIKIIEQQKWETSQFHLLKDDFSIGHIIHHGYVTVNEDGSISHISKHHPKDIKMNFYFGGAINQP